MLSKQGGAVHAGLRHMLRLQLAPPARGLTKATAQLEGAAQTAQEAADVIEEGRRAAYTLYTLLRRTGLEGAGQSAAAASAETPPELHRKLSEEGEARSPLSGSRMQPPTHSGSLPGQPLDVRIGGGMLQRGL